MISSSSSRKLIRSVFCQIRSVHQMAKIGFDADQAQLYDKSRPGYPNAALVLLNLSNLYLTRFHAYLPNFIITVFFFEPFCCERKTWVVQICRGNFHANLRSFGEIVGIGAKKIHGDGRKTFQLFFSHLRLYSIDVFHITIWWEEMVQQVNIVALMEDFQYFRSYEAAKLRGKSS